MSTLDLRTLVWGLVAMLALCELAALGLTWLLGRLED